MWMQAKTEMCSKISSPFYKFDILEFHDRIMLNTMTMRVNNTFPYVNFVLNTKWNSNYASLVHTRFNRISVLLLDAYERPIGYPPLHSHHVHINTDFHWFEVHGDYYSDMYAHSTPPGTSIAMHAPPEIEGVVNLVDASVVSMSFSIQIEFFKAHMYTRTVAKMWFQSDLEHDRQCWARYTVPNYASYSVWQGEFALDGRFETGWFHTHRARSNAVFLFKGRLDEFICDDIVCDQYFGRVKNIKSLHQYALTRRNLLCHEVHDSINDVSVFINGDYYDRHGSFSCRPFEFTRGEAWSMLIIHSPWFKKNEIVKQHSNIFMYVAPNRSQDQGRAFLNGGSFEQVNDT